MHYRVINVFFRRMLKRLGCHYAIEHQVEGIDDRDCRDGRGQHSQLKVGNANRPC